MPTAPTVMRKPTVLAGALGSGLLWGWSFLFYLASQSKIVSYETDWSDFAHAIASLAAVPVMWLLVSKKVVKSTEPFADVGCVMLVLGTIVSLFFSLFADASMMYLMIGKLLTGIGQTIFWTAWLVLLSRFEVGRAESSVLAWFPMGACMMAVTVLCNFAADSELIVLFTVLQCGIPLASLMLFRMAATALRRNIECDDDGQSRSKAMVADIATGRFGDIAGIGLALALVVFSWSVFLNERSFQLRGSTGLFALGLLLAMVPTWMALRSTRRFGPSTLLCWSLPLFGTAVVCDRLIGDVSPAIPFLCFAVVSSGLDAFFKLFIIHMGRRSPGSEDASVLVGVGVFTVAATTGSCAWIGALLLGLPASAFNVLLVALLLMIVTASAFLGRESVAVRDPNETSPEVEIDAPVCRLSESIGLSAREAEVLPLLLSGKSRAYIREALCISKGTVDTHVNHIYKKAGVSSRDELIRLAERVDARQQGNA